jgi:hypothetical protein
LLVNETEPGYDVLRTARPVAPWRTRRIPSSAMPLFDDASRRIGANIALKDAVRLRDALVAADRGVP